MIATLKAEFLKVFTVRSTYIILGISMAMELLFAFYLTGWRAKPDQLMSPTYLASQVTSALNVLILLASMVAILLITHEYRYNTIMHTLTSSRSRTKVMVAKTIVISVFAILFVLFFGAISPALSVLAIKMHHLTMAHQDFHTWNLLWRTSIYGWGIVMLASVLAFIIRIQVGAIVAFFLIPSMVENILGLLLKKNQVYLPFSSLSYLVGDFSQQTQISHSRAAMVGVSYVVVGWLIGLILFIKRDAN